MINVKILSLGEPERYAIRRLVMATQPADTELAITEVDDPGEIGKYAHTLLLPTLVINGKVVCSGRFPTKEEVLSWLQKARAK